MEKLKIMCTGEILIDFHKLRDLQLTEDGRSLKATSQEKIDKLAKSLQEYGIVNNLQVWKDGEDIYCFDAHHRKKALSQLEKEGVEIPLLPATRCLAETMDEAKKLLILKESSHSWVDVDVVKDYLEEIDFDVEEAQGLIEIPDFDWPEEIPEFDPLLPTGGKPEIKTVTFTLSTEQLKLISSLIKNEIIKNPLLSDPAGINKNRNGNALYSLCKKIH